MTIKIIIFDLGEVILNGVNGIEHTLTPILNIATQEIRKQIHDNNLEDLSHGKISEEGYWQKIIVKNNWNIDVKLLKQIVRNNFTKINGTLEIVQELKKAGYQLGLLSIHVKEWIDYCEQNFNYHNFFDTTMYSFQVGVSKPNTKAFELILSEMNANPKQTLFIDDSVKNIISAQQLGINTILFKNAEQLREELLAFNIQID